MADTWPNDPIVSAAPAAWPDDPIVASWPDDPVVAGPGSATLMDYPAELGKAAIRGSAAGLGTALQGLGARQAATEPILGQRLDESVAGALTQGRLPQVIQEPGTGQRRPIAEIPAYQAGQALTKAAETAFPSGKVLPQLAEDVAGGVGQVLTNIGTSMIPGVGPGLAAASILAQGPGEQAERVVKAKATPEQADLATSLGVIPGATEFIDLLLPKLGGLGQTLSLIKRMGVKAFAGAAAEGTQEAAQQFLQNAIERGIGPIPGYNPARGLGEDVAYSALVGGLTGGLVGGAMPGRREGVSVRFPATGQESAGVAAATQEEDPLAAAYGATVAPIEPTPIAPAGVPVEAGIDVSGAMRGGAAPTPSAPAVGEAVKEMGTPPIEAAATPPTPAPPLPSMSTTERIYQGRFTPLEVQTQMARNLQLLMNYQLALADPEIRRMPHRVKHVEEALPLLRAEILAQATFLNQTAPEQVPQVLLPPPSITQAEAAAGLEPPPNRLAPQPVITNVPEEVNATAANVIRFPTAPRTRPTVEELLGRPLDLTDEQVRTAAANFGMLRYALYDPESESVHVTSAFNISPGQKPIGERLIVPQDSISPRNTIIHSNTAVNPTGGPLTPGGPRADIVEAATAKFGRRFHDYIYQMGEHFKYLRDSVAVLAPPSPEFVDPQMFNYTEYSSLAHVGVGISFDPAYHGINVRVPVEVLFINIGNPNFTNPHDSAADMAHTMLHELAHHTYRSEERIEDVMADLMHKLIASPEFDGVEFKNSMVATAERHHDIMMWMKGLYEDGHVEPIGSPLAVGAWEPGVGGPGSGNLRKASDRSRPGWGSTLSDWAKIGAKSPRRVTDGKRGSATTSGVGGYRSRADYGLGANQRAINREVGHSGVTAYQQTPETQSTREAIRAALGDMPQAVAAQAAHADHINWLYKWMGSLLDLTQRNLRFTPLVRYTELARLWHMQESQVQDAAATIAKRWRGLGRIQSDALTSLFDDLTNMLYLTPTERAAGVVRNPTRTEFNAIANRYKVSPDALRVYADVRTFFTGFLGLTSQNARDAARRTISDPVALAKALDEIDAWVRTLGKRPYFPFLRFGSHYIHAKDARGNTEFFGLYERKGLLSARQVQLNMAEQVKRQYPMATIDMGVMPEDVRPFYGMPPSLLKMIHQKMNLSQAQIDAIEQLQFQMSPEMSFRHRFQHKSYTPGYSRDFIRAFSHYAFHGARYYAKTKYVWDMEDQIAAAKAVGGDKATRISNFMADHLQNTLLNIKGDHGLLKGIAFNWHLAFMPSSAFVNLTQTPLVTGPFLGHKFGDGRAAKAISNAIRKVSSYYRKESYQGLTEFEMRAISVGMKWGIVKETQASEVASLANGNTLLHGVGGTQAQQAMMWFQQKGALMFEAAEQFNRKIAYRAALELAQKDPNNRYVTEAMAKNPTLYQDLINGVGTGASGKFSPQEAQAIVTAFDVVEQTQFVYSRYARPRFMRGKWPGALFVFQRYNQGILFLLLNNDRGYKLRYLLTAAALGGLSGLMGYDEVKDLFEGIFKRLGYNLNVDTEIRKYVKQFTGSPEAADYILHGFARRGFGIPHVLDALGSFATGRPGRGLLDPAHMGGVNVPVPMLDMSKAITPKLLPIEVGKLITPFQDPKKLIADQGQKAAGAVFSIPVNIYKAVMNTKEEEDDRKRWEKAMPRALAGISKTFRTFSEGRERFGSAAPNSARTLVKYDVRDTEQAMEVIFKGMGFNPLRESHEWDFTRSNLEHKQYVEGTRKLLLEQMFEAVKTKDQKEIQGVREDIIKFNTRVQGTPDRGYAITADGLKQSMATRARELGMAEAGFSGRKREIPAIRDLREIYPRAVEIQRR